MKILIIKRDKIGDMILTTPIFKLIKTRLPSAELHLLANTYNGWVVENDPYLDRLWLYPRVREGGRVNLRAFLSQARQLWQLRRERYDWIVVANGNPSWRANMRARWIAGPGTRIVAYCEPNHQSDISDPLAPPTEGHETVRLARLLTPLSANISADFLSEIPFPHFRPREAWIESAKQFLAEHGLSPASYVILGVGSRRRSRQPDPVQVLRWAQTLHERFGLHTVFTWTPGRRDDKLYPGDDDIAETVLTNRPAWIHPYRGDLGTVVGLTWLAKTSLYPDSGLMHVAATCPGGVVGLFASSPEQWAPRGVHADVVVAQRNISELPDEVFLSALAKNMQPS